MEALRELVYLLPYLAVMFDSTEGIVHAKPAEGLLVQELSGYSWSEHALR